MLKSVVLLNIFVETVTFYKFIYLKWKSFETIKQVFTVTSDQFNAEKSIIW